MNASVDVHMPQRRGGDLTGTAWGFVSSCSLYLRVGSFISSGLNMPDYLASELLGSVLSQSPFSL